MPWDDAKPHGNIAVALLDNETRDQLLYIREAFEKHSVFPGVEGVTQGDMLQGSARITITTLVTTVQGDLAAISLGLESSTGRITFFSDLLEAHFCVDGENDSWLPIAGMPRGVDLPSGEIITVEDGIDNINQRVSGAKFDLFSIASRLIDVTSPAPDGELFDELQVLRGPSLGISYSDTIIEDSPGPVNGGDPFNSPWLSNITIQRDLSGRRGNSHGFLLGGISGYRSVNSRNPLINMCLTQNLDADPSASEEASIRIDDDNTNPDAFRSGTGVQSMLYVTGLAAAVQDFYVNTRNTSPSQDPLANDLYWKWGNLIFIDLGLDGT